MTSSLEGSEQNPKRGLEVALFLKSREIKQSKTLCEVKYKCGEEKDVKMYSSTVESVANIEPYLFLTRVSRCC